MLQKLQALLFIAALQQFLLVLKRTQHVRCGDVAHNDSIFFAHDHVQRFARERIGLPVQISNQTAKHARVRAANPLIFQTANGHGRDVRHGKIPVFFQFNEQCAPFATNEQAQCAIRHAHDLAHARDRPNAVKIFDVWIFHARVALRGKKNALLLIHRLLQGQQRTGPRYIKQGGLQRKHHQSAQRYDGQIFKQFHTPWFLDPFRVSIEYYTWAYSRNQAHPATQFHGKNSGTAKTAPLRICRGFAWLFSAPLLVFGLNPFQPIAHMDLLRAGSLAGAAILAAILPHFFRVTLEERFKIVEDRCLIVRTENLGGSALPPGRAGNIRNPCNPRAHGFHMPLAPARACRAARWTGNPRQPR